MAGKKVLSIEIGNKFTRIVEVDYKVKNPKVYHTATMETPEGIVDDGILNITPEYVKMLKHEISRSGMRAKQVIFTIISSKIATREITIPKVKENRIAPMIEANASDYFPVDLSEYELAHIILDTIQEEGDVEKYKIMVLIAAKSMLEKYEQLAQECGLNMVAIDYSGNSLYQMVKKECSSDISMVIKVEGVSCMITIIENGAMIMQRTISYGLDPVIECYRETEKKDYTYHQVLEELKKHSYFDVNSTDVGPIYGGDSLADLLVEAFAYTLRGISRIYDYHNSRNGQKTINKIYVTGLGAGVNGLTSYIHDRLGVEAYNINLSGEYHFNKTMDNEQANRYIACLGAAVAPVGFISDKKEDRKKGKEQEQAESKNAVKVLAGCLAASAALLLVGTIPYATESMQKKENYQKLEALSSNIPIYQEYVQTKNADNYLKAAYEQTLLPTDGLVAFIEEMEEKMPQDMYVTSFSANHEGVAFSVVVNTKQQAADALLQLRTFESLVNINVNEITDSRSQEGDGVVTFSVSADYVNAPVKNVVGENNIGVTAGEAMY